MANHAFKPFNFFNIVYFKLKSKVKVYDCKQTKLIKMTKKSFRVFALIAFTFTTFLNYSYSQKSRDVEKQEFLNKELNLSPRQADDMKALKEESFIQRNRMKDKMKTERRAFRDNHDKKLRSILDEKQYYAFKQKSKEHRKHQIKKHKNKMRGMKRNHRGVNDFHRERN